MAARVTTLQAEALTPGTGASRVTTLQAEALTPGTGASRVTTLQAEVLVSLELARPVLRLLDGDGNPLANLTGLQWAWFDETTLDSLSVPTDNAAGAETDANGDLSLSLYNTSLLSGQTGSVIVQDVNSARRAYLNITI